MIKGYILQSGYKGLIDDQYQLFPTEDEYLDIVKEEQEEE